MARPKGPDLKCRSYADFVRHDQHWAFMRKRAQAKYRGESWTLTIEDWFALWDASGQWHNRGRHPHASAVFMCDPELGWHADNVKVCDRTVELRELMKIKQSQGKMLNGC